ncbi:transposase [Micromonospora sp. WMMD729]|uniref:transposase n=1 Tax=Micromonospora sp. WMMD729 TaxID=3404127 RepID=UPI003BF542F7
MEVSSGDVQRHRLSRAGDRQLNYALHVMAMAQIKRATPGRNCYQRNEPQAATGAGAAIGCR